MENNDFFCLNSNRKCFLKKRSFRSNIFNQQILALASNEENIKKIKRELEILEKLEDLKKVGNFKESLKDKNITLEELLISIENMFFKYDHKGMIKWVQNLLEYNKVLINLHQIYKNFNLYKKTLVHLLSYVLNALERLSRMQTFEYAESIYLITLHHYKNIFSLEGVPFLNYIDSIERQLKNNLLKARGLFGTSEDYIENCYFSNDANLSFTKNYSIFDYEKSSKEYDRAGFFSWYTAVGFPMLGIYPKVLAFHNIYKSLPGELLIKHYMLSLSHELFHQITYLYEVGIQHPNFKPFDELTTELRRFAFFNEFYEYFKDLKRLYLSNAKYKISINPYLLIPPIYFSGVRFLIAIFDLDYYPENINQARAFCESSSLEERLVSLNIALINSFNKEKKIIREIQHESRGITERFREIIETPCEYFLDFLQKEALAKLLDLTDNKSSDRLGIYHSFGLMIVFFIASEMTYKTSTKLFMIKLKSNLQKYKNSYLFYEFRKEVNESLLIEKGPLSMSEDLKKDKMEFNEKMKRMKGEFQKELLEHPEKFNKDGIFATLKGSHLGGPLPYPEFIHALEEQGELMRKTGVPEETIENRKNKLIKFFYPLSYKY